MMRTDNGFTLLEMLVALAVMSLAALALIRLDAVAVRGAADLGNDGIARIVVANAASDLLTDPTPPAIGAHSARVDNGGMGWTVRRHVELMPDPGLLQVRIDASGDQGGRATLTLMRPAR